MFIDILKDHVDGAGTNLAESWDERTSRSLLELWAEEELRTAEQYEWVWVIKYMAQVSLTPSIENVLPIHPTALTWRQKTSIFFRHRRRKWEECTLAPIEYRYLQSGHFLFKETYCFQQGFKHFLTRGLQTSKNKMLPLFNFIFQNAEKYDWTWRMFILHI